jgi:hypothetical protein
MYLRQKQVRFELTSQSRIATAGTPQRRETDIQLLTRLAALLTWRQLALAAEAWRECPATRCENKWSCHGLACNQAMQLLNIALLTDLFSNVIEVFRLVVRVVNNLFIARARLSRSPTQLGRGCVLQRHCKEPYYEIHERFERKF